MKKLLLLLLITTAVQSIAATLPTNLKWITNNKDPIYSSPKAVKGGMYIGYLLSFPLTLRYIGPDSNGGFRSYIDGNRMGLTSMHPNTSNIIPALATHWAYGNDYKTVYYKLDKRAKWSDGQPVTADDYLFTMEFMKSKHIVAPWYNNHITEEFENVVKYDDHTISITSAKKRPHIDLHLYTGLEPTPKHFVKLDKDFIKNYNWKFFPNTGAYQIAKVEKGKYITFKRKKNWWAKDLRYNKNRFNVDTIKFKVIRDMNVAWEHFKKGKLDSFGATLPDYWHKKTTGKLFDNGYIHKLWFYTDSPQPNYGIWLNEDYPLFKDINVRKAFGHAMNIDKVIKTVLRNDYERLHSSKTGNGKYTNTKIRARAFDLKKVEMYLKKAGWDKRGPDGIRVKGKMRLEAIVTYGAPHHKDRLVIIKEEAKKAGIELNLKLLDGATSFKVILEKKHQIAWMGWGTGLRPAFWQHLHSDNAHKTQTNNISNTDNKELDKMIMAYRNEFNETKKQKLSRQIQQFEYDNAAYIPTFLVPYFRIAYWSYWKSPKVPATKVSDGSFDLFGSTGGLFWLDKKLKEKVKKSKRKGKKLKAKTVIDKTFKHKG